MTKAELQSRLAKHERDKIVLVNALIQIRQGSRNCIPKDETPNPVWIIETVTEALTKVKP